jgi:DNA-binding PadR family transcriptional regulator
MPPSPRDPADYLPLTTPVYHVLVALADDEQHGYAIIKTVARQTDDRVLLSTGTLYGIIKRLLADGLIVELARRPAAANDDERRRYYRITDFGRRVAIAEARRLEHMVSVARATRLLDGPKRA